MDEGGGERGRDARIGEVEDWLEGGLVRCEEAGVAGNISVKFSRQWGGGERLVRFMLGVGSGILPFTCVLWNRRTRFTIFRGTKVSS